MKVTPFVGVWIETHYRMCVLFSLPSHPSWVCGLKQQNQLDAAQTRSVTPFVGVWIETAMTDNKIKNSTSHPSWVCGLKRIWDREKEPRLQSHPSWVCGLKLDLLVSSTLLARHTLRGCVD